MPSFSEIKNHKTFIILVDLLCILTAYVSAFFVRYQGFPQRNWDSFVSLLPWILLIGLFIISVYELYALDRKNTFSDIFVKVMISVIIMAFLTMAGSYLFRAFAMPRSVIFIASIFMVILLLTWKMLYLKLTRGKVEGTILLIGDNESSQELISKIKHPMLKGTKVNHIQPNTPMEKIDQLLKSVDFVVISPNITKEKKSQIIYHAMENEKIVYVIPSLYDLLLQRASVSPLEDTLAMAVKPFGLTIDQAIIKRIFDFSASAIFLLIISPVLLVTALAIKIDDPKGRVIYKQERIGKNNKPFTIYKFRSMVEGAEAKTGPVLATENDNRITKVGKFMRSIRLDELPQLINVIKGDMSLVGPRPERKFFTKKLAKQYYHYSYRTSVKPGITGYAQIMGKYSTNVEDKLRFDLYYIRNYSFWLDIVILLKTIIVLFDKTKAEGTESKQQGKSKDIIADAKANNDMNVITDEGYKN